MANIINPFSFVNIMALRHRYSGLEYVEAAKFNVIFKDVFSLKYIYTLSHEWLIEFGYTDRNDEKFPETMYIQKDLAGGVKELWIRWRLSKNPVSGKSKFWNYMFDIDIHVLGMTDVEVMMGTKKIKMNKGEVEFQVAANLVWDASKEWEKSAWLKPFKQVFLKRVVREKREELKTKLYDEAYRYQGILKSYMQLDNYLKEPEGGAFWRTVKGE